LQFCLQPLIAHAVSMFSAHTNPPFFSIIRTIVVADIERGTYTEDV